MARVLSGRLMAALIAVALALSCLLALAGPAAAQSTGGSGRPGRAELLL